MAEHKLFGVTGWKNTGKTTLICNLVKEFTRRGYTVATVKHAHHRFDIDHEGTDSYKHRQAGAREVALVSSKRWAIMHEVGDDLEPTLASVLQRLSPCDLVLVEGYKAERHPKIESIRPEAAREEAIWKSDTSIVALAADQPVPDCTLPRYAHEATERFADMIIDRLGLEKRDATE